MNHLLETQEAFLKKSLAKLAKKGLQYNIGPEPEFFIVDIDEEG